MRTTWLLGTLFLLGGTLAAAEWGLKPGNPELKSAGSITFGPDGILLVGDAKSATVFALDTGDTKGEPAKAKHQLDGVGAKLAAALQAPTSDVAVVDLAVNPLSGNLYFSVLSGSAPAIVRLDTTGKLSPLSLKNIAFASIALPNAPEDKEVAQGPRKINRRTESITDLAYSQGKVLVSGLSGDAAPSNVREIPFPFTTADTGTSIEIFHGAHGKLEDYAAVRAFVPFTINGEPSLLAGFTCTPLVKFPLNVLEPGKKVRGTTVAELGNRNKPLDMIVYRKDGKDFLLMANSARGVMKISTENLQRQDGITSRIDGTAGQPYETIKDLQGVVQLDKLNDEQAVILVQADGGLNLRTIALP